MVAMTSLWDRQVETLGAAVARLELVGTTAERSDSTPERDIEESHATRRLVRRSDFIPIVSLQAARCVVLSHHLQARVVLPRTLRLETPDASRNVALHPAAIGCPWAHRTSKQPPFHFHHIRYTQISLGDETPADESKTLTSAWRRQSAGPSPSSSVRHAPRLIQIHILICMLLGRDAVDADPDGQFHASTIFILTNTTSTMNTNTTHASRC